MDARSGQLRRALILSAVSVTLSGIAGSIATYAALLDGSLSLLGFGIDAVIDSVASIALIWRFVMEVRRPLRAEQVERIAERVVGIALVALSVYLVQASVRSLLAQAHPETSTASVALLVSSVIALPPLAISKYRYSDRLASGALRADSILTAVAAVLAAISLASLAATSLFGLWWADAVGAIVVAVIVVREGWSSLRLPRSVA